MHDCVVPTNGRGNKKLFARQQSSPLLKHCGIFWVFPQRVMFQTVGQFWDTQNEPSNKRFYLHE